MTRCPTLLLASIWKCNNLKGPANEVNTLHHCSLFLSYPSPEVTKMLAELENPPSKLSISQVQKNGGSYILGLATSGRIFA